MFKSNFGKIFSTLVVISIIFLGVYYFLPKEIIENEIKNRFEAIKKDIISYSTAETAENTENIEKLLTGLQALANSSGNG